MLRVSLPARINIVGSPTDAVEGAYATISAAVDIRGGATFRPAPRLRFERPDGQWGEFDCQRIAEPTIFDIEAAAVNSLLAYAPEFGSRLREQPVAVQTWTDVPASSGMAGSSVLLLAVLVGLRAFYNLDPRRLNDYVLAEIAQRAEEQEMGIVCGFADRYVPLFGDIAYLGYHGKLWHAPLGEEPYVTYEKLGPYLEPLRFVVATTGVERNSGSVHAPMRARYLEQRRAGDGPLLPLCRAIGETAWRAKAALLAGDLAALGAQIDRNQDLVDELMRQCGFSTGAGTEVRLLVDAARGAGALGAKLTGAGGGGAIFALARSGEEETVRAAIESAARRAGLDRSQAFITSVTATGAIVERDSEHA